MGHVGNFIPTEADKSCVVTWSEFGNYYVGFEVWLP